MQMVVPCNKVRGPRLYMAVEFMLLDCIESTGHLCTGGTANGNTTLLVHERAAQYKSIIMQEVKLQELHESDFMEPLTFPAPIDSVKPWSGLW